MKHKLRIKVLTLFLILCFDKSWGQAILQWNTFGNLGTETSEPSVFNDPNLSASTLTLGAGITAAANGNRLGGSSWATSLANAITGNDYIEFSVTPAAGCSVTPTSFIFNWQTSNAVFTTVTLRSSADGFATDIGSQAVTTAITQYTITIPGITNNPGPLTFRLYGYGASVAAGTTGGFDQGGSSPGVVNVQLNGSTSCGNTITTGLVSTSPFSLPTCTATATGTVAFTSTGTFTGNTYTAQLSDATGSFAAPTNIGTLVSNANSGDINITIPAGTGSGGGYLIRVISDGPSITGSNSSAFTVTLTCAGSGSCTINGAIGSGYNVGCGNGATPCNLASVYSSFGTFCGGTAVTCGSCPNTNVSSTYNLGAGCTATLIAEFKARTIAGSDCSNSAMDGSDQLSITNSGGVVSSQTSTMAVTVATCGAYPALGTYTTAVSSLSVGCGNSGGTVQMIITGGSITVGGTMNRGDEILTYTLSASGSCSACPVLLPVDFVDFYATQNGDKNDVFWKVINEENIRKYIIEKSEDGINFSELINQKSNGNTSGLINYSGEDLNPLEDITYYRLVTVENNFAVKYHKTISLDRTNQEWKTVFYQQNNNLFLEFKNSIPKNSAVSLFDLSGKLLADETIKNSQTIINTQNFAEGIYFLRISTPYKTENFKLIIQK